MKNLLLTFGALLSFQSFAQVDVSRDVYATAGTEMNSTDLNISFTLGEVFTNSFEQSDETHTLGFQQGDLSLASIHAFSNDSFALFPNPADAQVTFTTSSSAPFTYRVYDITGRVVLDGKSASGAVTLEVSNLVEGKYFLEYLPEMGETHYLSFITIH